MATVGGRAQSGRSGRRRASWLVPVAIVCAAALIPGAALAKQVPVSTVSVSPANPLGSKPIVVTWYADRAPRADRDYSVDLRIDGQGGRCRSTAEVVLPATWKKGQTVRATLRPSRATEQAWWCLGNAKARVIVRSGVRTTRIASQLFMVRNDPASPTPRDPVGTPVRITLLGGSAMTVKVAGRPDRSAPLTGTLRAFLPGLFKPGSNLLLDSMSGTVTVGGLPPDPLCPSNGHPSTTTFDVTDLSSMVLLASGNVIFTFVPSEELLGVAGCQGPAAAFTRSFALGARVGPAGLVNLPMSGSIGDVPMNDGTAASIVLTLVVNLDLSGR